MSTPAHVLPPEIQRLVDAARQDALEEAYQIAHDHALRAWDIGKELGQNDVCCSGRNHGARAVANAIRSLFNTGERI